MKCIANERGQEFKMEYVRKGSGYAKDVDNLASELEEKQDAYEELEEKQEEVLDELCQFDDDLEKLNYDKEEVIKEFKERFEKYWK